MLAFEKVMEVFTDHLAADDVFEVLHNRRGYTVMIWEEQGEEWFGVEYCKTPEDLRDALIRGFWDFTEQKITLNRRGLTEQEKSGIEAQCRVLCERCSSQQENGGA